MNESKAKKVKVVGIDLGTTNSCIAEKDYGVISNFEGKNTTPSVVSIEEDGRILVGELAKNQAAVSEQFISLVKRSMGTKATFTLGSKEFSPEQISAEILSKLLKDAKDRLDAEIGGVVVTVPAYFTDSQRKATANAVEIAGYKLLKIINEPTAAALAYGLNQSEAEQKILVYDLGGGTFDVSILSISKEEEGSFFQVLSTAGINDLGGHDFDQRIVEIISSDFKSKTGIDLLKKIKEDNTESRIIRHRLFEAAEKAKHELSSKMQAEITISFLLQHEGKPVHLQTTLSRAKFESSTADFLKRTREKVFEALSSANTKLSASDIGQVVLVGGSTRMPMVDKLISEIFTNKKINKSVNPDEVVALGAAIQASILSGDVKNVILSDVTPFSLGIETEGGLMSNIIQKNTAIPFSHKEIYSTAVDNQPAVTISIYEGDRPRALDNKLLGSFTLEDIEKAKRGVPRIEVEFSIDSSGILSVSASDEKTKKNKSIKIQSVSLSKEEIERMKKEAEENRALDEEFKLNIENLNRAQSYLYTFQKQDEEFKNNENFNPEDESYKNFRKMYEDLEKAINEKDYPSLKTQLDGIDQLMKASSDLQEKMKKNKEGMDDNSGEDILDIPPEKENDDK